jgi:hypothetical protein
MCLCIGARSAFIRKGAISESRRTRGWNRRVIGLPANVRFSVACTSRAPVQPSEHYQACPLPRASDLCASVILYCSSLTFSIHSTFLPFNSS